MHRPGVYQKALLWGEYPMLPPIFNQPANRWLESNNCPSASRASLHFVGQAYYNTIRASVLHEVHIQLKRHRKRPTPPDLKTSPSRQQRQHRQPASSQIRLGLYSLAWPLFARLINCSVALVGAARAESAPSTASPPLARSSREPGQPRRRSRLLSLRLRA